MPVIQKLYWNCYGEFVEVFGGSDWYNDFPVLPDTEAYEQTSLHCYKADRRICMQDEINRLKVGWEEDAAILAMRLGGVAF